MFLSIIKFVKANKLYLVTLLFIFLVTFALSGYFSTIGTDPHHDGIVFKPALDLSNKKMLFRDSFTQYGTLTTVIQTLSLLIFGKYLIVIKLLTAFFYGLIAITAFTIWNKFLNKKLAFLSWIFWLPLAPYYIGTFLPWSSVYALFTQCLSLYFSILYIQKRNNKYILLSGILAGATFWFKQNVGLYTVAGFILTIFILYVKKNVSLKISFNLIKIYILGILLVSLPILIWLFMNNAIVDWWKQSILFAQSWASESKLYPYQHFFPASFSTISVWALAPVLVVVVFLKEFFNKKANLILISICLFSICSWLQYFPIPDIRHTYWAGTLYIGIMSYSFLKLAESINSKNIQIKYLIFLGICFVIFFNDTRTGIKRAYVKAHQQYYYLSSPSVLQGMKLPKSQYLFYKSVNDSIVKYEKQHGKKYLITTAANALYLTFSDSINFSPIYVDWTYIKNSNLYPDYWQKRDKFIKENKPFIMTVTNKFQNGYCNINNKVNPEDLEVLTVPCN